MLTSIYSLTCPLIIRNSTLDLDWKKKRFSSLYFFFPCFQNLIADLISDAPVVADKTSEEDEEVLQAIAASMEGIKGTSGWGSDDEDENLTNREEITCQDKKPSYPPLPEEPKGDKTLLCRVGIRLPDGRRVQRNFLRTDPIQVKIDYGELLSSHSLLSTMGASIGLCPITLNASVLTNCLIVINYQLAFEVVLGAL